MLETDRDRRPCRFHSIYIVSSSGPNSIHTRWGMNSNPDEATPVGPRDVIPCEPIGLIRGHSTYRGHSGDVVPIGGFRAPVLPRPRPSAVPRPRPRPRPSTSNIVNPYVRQPQATHASWTPEPDVVYEAPPRQPKRRRVTLRPHNLIEDFNNVATTDDQENEHDAEVAGDGEAYPMGTAFQLLDYQLPSGSASSAQPDAEAIPVSSSPSMDASTVDHTGHDSVVPDAHAIDLQDAPLGSTTVELDHDTTIIDVPDDEPISTMSELPSIPPLPSDPRAREDDEETLCWGTMAPIDEDGGSVTLDSRSSIYNTQLSAEDEDGEEESLTSDLSEDVVQLA